MSTEKEIVDVTNNYIYFQSFWVNADGNYTNIKFRCGSNTKSPGSGNLGNSKVMAAIYENGSLPASGSGAAPWDNTLGGAAMPWPKNKIAEGEKGHSINVSEDFWLDITLENAITLTRNKIYFIAFKVCHDPGATATTWQTKWYGIDDIGTENKNGGMAWIRNTSLGNTVATQWNSLPTLSYETDTFGSITQYYPPTRINKCLWFTAYGPQTTAGASIGPTGPKGEQGNKGDKGDQGGQGVTGPEGDKIIYGNSAIWKAMMLSSSETIANQGTIALNAENREKTENGIIFSGSNFTFTDAEGDGIGSDYDLEPGNIYEFTISETNIVAPIGTVVTQEFNDTRSPSNARGVVYETLNGPTTKIVIFAKTGNGFLTYYPTDNFPADNREELNVGSTKINVSDIINVKVRDSGKSISSSDGSIIFDAGEGNTWKITFTDFFNFQAMM